jgi:hypothetical protein
MGWPKEVRNRIRRRLVGYDYRESAKWREAEEWYKSFKPEPGRDYGFLWEFSRSRFDYMTDVLHQIDDKADALFRFAAILAAALATALKLLEAPKGVMIAALPSLVLFAVAIACALIAKKPTLTGGPMEIDGAMQLPAEEEKAIIAAQHHSACVAIGEAVARKTAWIEAATWLIVAGIAMLALFAAR